MKRGSMVIVPVTGLPVNASRARTPELLTARLRFLAKAAKLVGAVAAAHGADAGGVDGRRPRGAAPVISHGRVKDYLICRAAARMGWSEFG